MGNKELPSRAKPEVLHELCKYLRSTGGAEKTDIYDDLDIDRRQIRAALDYGAKLEFLKVEEDFAQVTDRGTGISWNESVDDAAVRAVFRDAIKSYEPYRETFLRIHADSLVDDVKGTPVIKQSSFKSKAEESMDKTLSNREINLLIKTAQAAGLGEFITGRKGLETRLKISNQYDDFLGELTDQYPLPEAKEEVEEEETEESSPADTDNPPEANAIGSSGRLSLTVELDVNDKSEEQIASIINRIRSME